MRYLFIPVCLLAFTFTACKKSSGGSSGSTGGTGGTTGGTTDLTIAGINPVHPYTDDEFSITGTGFNTDATKDTVLVATQLVNITSATATEFKIKLTTNAISNLGICNCGFIQVRANGKRLTSANSFTFKTPLTLAGISNIDNSNLGYGRAGDSLVFGGVGIIQAADTNIKVQTLSIDGKNVPNFKIAGTSSAGQVTVRLAPEFFGDINDPTIQELKTVTITNPDGRSSSKQFQFYTSPSMKVSSVTPSQATYSLSNLAATGGNILLKVVGQYLKDDTKVVVGTTGYTQESTLSLGGVLFPNQATIVLTPGPLPAGNYTVNLWRGTVLYGGGSFRLDP